MTRSYYGRPILKKPVWQHDIPAYFFTGGLAAGSALLAAGADLTGRPRTRRAARLAALGALGVSTYFLVNDLGRPERFHHMLRVAKPTSPMSVGTWMLSAFGGAAGLAAAAEARPRGWTGRAGRLAGVGAAALAPGIATYTAVLIADTAAPSWHAAADELPFAFAGSALASGAAVGLIAAPMSEGGPARTLAVTGVALELAATHRIETRLGLEGEPYRTGKAGRLLRAARALNLAGAAGAVLGRRSRVLSALSGVALLAGSLATRFGVFEAGVASTEDPKYVVEPQRGATPRHGSAPVRRP
ncbi:NrfD/PsrC family molybdoenzyme membrane anchor subunit [Dactylosporangium darangshiense]|uniref:NrfD/PsrC family molybdoenzyme membrane anchor subunit n=1 Tax=Dactylosporangium darangshiense TaxID=579108 RepID=UPI0036444455